MAQEMWKICGYDGANLIFEQFIPMGSLSEQEIVVLLQRLQSRHLSAEEVVSASMRKNSKAYVPHLEVVPNTGGKPALMTTGSGWHYIATIEDDQ